MTAFGVCVEEPAAGVTSVISTSRSSAVFCPITCTSGDADAAEASASLSASSPAVAAVALTVISAVSISSSSSPHLLVVGAVVVFCGATVCAACKSGGATACGTVCATVCGRFVLSAVCVTFCGVVVSAICALVCGAGVFDFSGSVLVVLVPGGSLSGSGMYACGQTAHLEVLAINVLSLRLVLTRLARRSVDKYASFSAYLSFPL